MANSNRTSQPEPMTEDEFLREFRRALMSAVRVIDRYRNASLGNHTRDLKYDPDYNEDLRGK